MKTLATVGCFLLVVVMAVLAPQGSARASPEDDEMLRATIRTSLAPRDKDEIHRLLDRGANPNAPDKFGRTAMHYAAGHEWGTTEVGTILTLFLLEGGKCCLNDNQGDTPLHFAVAAANHVTADFADLGGRIRRLLDNGAKPNEPNRRGYTPLHFAAKTSAWTHGTAVIDRLLRAGGDPDWESNDGNTPLHLATGVSVILDGGHGHSVISMGTAGGEHLLTSDDIALSAGVKVVDALLAGGANPNVVNAAGMTPLLAALTSDDNSLSEIVSVAESLLSGGADPNVKAPDDMSPLHIVLDYPDRRSSPAPKMTEKAIPLVRSLLGAGADADRKNPEGDTPLHMAVRQEWGREMVEALLAGGADPCIRNERERWMPEQLARGLGQSSVEHALQQAGGLRGRVRKEGRGQARPRPRRASAHPVLPPGRGLRSGDAGRPLRSAHAGRHRRLAGGAGGGRGRGDGVSDAGRSRCAHGRLQDGGPTPACSEESDTPCWMETANQPGCYIWNSESGTRGDRHLVRRLRRRQGLRQGRLGMAFSQGREWKESSGQGQMSRGQPVGHWVYRFSDGRVWKAPS